ncbi:hypothetical protein BT69DRAFT_315061 [Atractiella rhizophila]|nr:hypothetical protein BT69DRAFT_315061 [Atractiella rhizophila]
MMISRRVSEKYIISCQSNVESDCSNWGRGIDCEVPVAVTPSTVPKSQPTKRHKDRCRTKV